MIDQMHAGARVAPIAEDLTDAILPVAREARGSSRAA